MSVEEQVSLADAKNRLSEVVDTVQREHARVVITKHGKPSAVIVSIDDLESLEETLAILSDAELMADVRRSRADIEAGRVEWLSADDLRARLTAR